MTTDLVVSYRQEVGGSQARTVGRENPRRQQEVVGAGAGSSLHLSCGSHPARDGVVIQGHRTGLGNLHPAEAAEYTLVYQALLRRETHERAKHSSVVVDCGGSEMSHGIVKIGVDLVRRQVGGCPGQTANQDKKLGEVTLASPDALPVNGGEINERHGEYTMWGGTYPQLIADSTPRNNRYNPTTGQLAQLYSGPRGWTALRILWVATLAAFIFLRWSGFALTALLLGQFAQAAAEYRRVYGRTRAPRKGPS